MNVAEIITAVREDILDDAVVPYLWSNDALIRCLNKAYEELARESRCIIDGETTAVCRVPLLANQTLHSLHSKIVYVFDGYRESDGYRLAKKTEAYLQYFTNWRTTVGTPYLLVMDSTNRKFSVYPKFNTNGYVLGVSNISFVALTKTISQAGADFDTYFTAGESFVINDTTSNDGTFTVDSSTDTTIVTVEALVDEAATSAKIQLERDAVILRVARLPLTPYVANDIELATPPTPEIDSDYHYDLLPGIAKYAYLKHDSETYDLKESQRHAATFQQFKDMVRLNMLVLVEGNESQMSPHLGTL